MRIQLKYIVLFSLILASYLVIMAFGTTTLETDKNFQKLTSPEGNSLIIGTSRAARLKGSEIRKAISPIRFENDSFLNYAFNLSVSPYGPAYNNSVVQLAQSMPKSGPRVFILAIDPWALSEPKEDGQFPEDDTYITFNRNNWLPEVSYLYEFYDKPLISLFSNHYAQKRERLKNLSKLDTAQIRKHSDSKIKYYRENHVRHDTFSHGRAAALDDLIRSLKQHGQVYLLRVPVSKEMAALENEYCPNFMDLILASEERKNTPLLDFYPYANDYDCFDANHLFEEDAVAISQTIGSIIKWQSEQLEPVTNNVVSNYYGALDQ
jgi:hypothetical protein